ncbi:uncharacterized protein LOC143879804 isoform X1 [Tasmannia lanceolata]|uniref:uncharacterized protein LOC143879804 isoform X1 n=1 Tax=Tasmannia lanceolata TaxID=3420 RepID=UPI00406323A7
MLESMEEFEEWKKLKTAVMMEKCRCRNEGVVCPKPRKGYMRYSGENIEAKVGAELSDIISKASPPYYSVSPPIRASNPLIQDTLFQEQRVSQSPISVSGLVIGNRSRSIRCVSTVV